jgi:hypothetical protein
MIVSVANQRAAALDLRMLAAADGHERTQDAKMLAAAGFAATQTIMLLRRRIRP